MRTPSTLLKKVTWVNVGGSSEGYYATCTRCGAEEEKPRLPMPFESLHWWAIYVLSRHADCEAPNV